MRFPFVHPSLDTLRDLAERPRAAPVRVATHIAHCARCREMLELFERLDRLREEDEPLDLPANLFATIAAERAWGEHETRRTNRRDVPARNLPLRSAGPPLPLAVAMAAAVFVAGVVFGRATNSATSTSAPAAQSRPLSPTNATLDAALDVQRRGSAYVAAITRLQTHARSDESDDVRQGYQSALATLHAAATELRAVAPDDDAATDLMTVARLAQTHADRTVMRHTIQF